MKRNIASAICLGLGLAGPAMAQSATDCADLTGLSSDGVTITTAEFIDTGSFTPPGQEPLTDLPPFCRVALTIDPEISVEVWMPSEGWTGRFVGIGGGGYAGFIEYQELAGGLREGSAVANTDTGHPGNPILGGFAFDDTGTVDMDKVVTFASRGIIEMTHNAKNVVAAFYGEPAAYSYWSGCSTGGRQGLMQVQRTPDAYDGVIAGAPAINWERFIAAEIWPQIVMHEMLGGPIAQSKWDAVSTAARAACDAGDGLEDGAVANPARCDFDPAELQCGAEGGDACLTADEVTAVRAIWDGPMRADGTPLWFGLDPTVPIGGLAGEQAFPIAVEHARWVMDDPDFDWRTITMADFPAYFDASNAKFNDVIGTDEADLSGFRDAGGKLIIWHGWEDQLIFAPGSIDYYDRVVANTGGLDRTQDFARLFMAPGVEHCAGGTGPNAFGTRNARLPVTMPLKMDAEHDLFHAITRWVEEGVAPDHIIATRYTDNDLANGVERTRPLCPYPLVAIHDGTGDIDDAASFTCGEDPGAK
ncbi:tannase/feruloyl esterase family alpha/beta hydrolase [Maritimibacter alexandrii]|uniref:tannase/feruloyl esterase family alpha/beta hydrolase n=1 Tax=Maritimibacter alexandrii TaxID=2570355 RepID=UPI0011097AE9|nr:tannase/feruloyl esterase family alpha/beta hydrolase [Maritimibacter alexandrii]